MAVGFFIRAEHILFWCTGFESGFSRFRELTITSLVRFGRLYLNGAFISLPFADALRIGEKKCKKTNLRITYYTQTENVHSNPQNQENPDSKPSVRR